MPNERNKRVIVHHPGLRQQAEVRARQAKVLAQSGWQIGELPSEQPAAKSKNTGNEGK